MGYCRHFVIIIFSVLSNDLLVPNRPYVSLLQLILLFPYNEVGIPKRGRKKASKIEIKILLKTRLPERLVFL